MPPTTRRKSSNPVSNTQPTLSFHSRSNKITKPSLSSASKVIKTKNAKADGQILAASLSTPSPIAEDVKVQTIEEPSTADLAIRQQQRAEKSLRTGAEDEAAKISDAKLKRYWSDKELERKAPRVHQRGLAMHDKILREFDLSYQFGPCVGISRMKRWRRAETLGLKPPIEVLAVLLKEDASNNATAERAYMDELLSSKFLND